jgi:hypothetical protein
MKVLVIDVGGTNIKIKVSNKDEVRKFPSGTNITGNGCWGSRKLQRLGL